MLQVSPEVPNFNSRRMSLNTALRVMGLDRNKRVILRWTKESRRERSFFGPGKGLGKGVEGRVGLTGRLGPIWRYFEEAPGSSIKEICREFSNLCSLS